LYFSGGVEVVNPILVTHQFLQFQNIACHPDGWQDLFTRLLITESIIQMLCLGNHYRVRENSLGHKGFDFYNMLKLLQKY
jgi:hypothetical protein